MARDQLGGFFGPRKPLPLQIREEIVDLQNSVSKRFTSDETCSLKIIEETQNVSQGVGPESYICIVNFKTNLGCIWVILIFSLNWFPN